MQLKSFICEVDLIYVPTSNVLLQVGCIQRFVCCDLTLRNSGFFIPRFNSLKYGKHNLWTNLWSKLKSKDRKQISLSAFKRKIRNTDLSTLHDKFLIIIVIIVSIKINKIRIGIFVI